MDRLVVREYECETDAGVELLLKPVPPQMGCVELDLYDRILAVVAAGLMQRAAQVRVSWYDAQSGRVETETFTDAGDNRGLFLRLYGAMSYEMLVEAKENKERFL